MLRRKPNRMCTGSYPSLDVATVKCGLHGLHMGRVLHSTSGPVERGVEHEDLKECCMASVKAYNHADVHMPADTRGRRVRMSGWLFRVLRGYPCLLGAFCLG